MFTKLLEEALLTGVAFVVPREACDACEGAMQTARRARRIPSQAHSAWEGAVAAKNATATARRIYRMFR